jgi:hypothetical protein
VRAWAGLALLASCTTNWEESQVDGLRVLSTVQSPTSTQRFPLSFEVLEGEESFLLTLEPSTDALGFVLELEKPGGDTVFLASDFWESPNTRTTAAFSATVTNLAWPITREDAQLEPGRWRVDARVEDPGSDVDVSVTLRGTDADPDVDTLKVEIVLLGDLAEDDEVSRAVQAAYEHWRDNIYGPAGIVLDGNISTWDADATIDSPNMGNPVYEEIAEAFPLDTLVVVVADRLLDGVGVLGVSGGIPGPLQSTERSAIAVSTLEAAGADGLFSRVEQLLFGETMAHEVGHYLGLFHPVELPTGNVPDTFDSLDDTPECERLPQCDDLLASNLMYPTPVCEPGAIEGFNSCSAFISQTELSVDQRDLVDRYVAIE